MVDTTLKLFLRQHGKTLKYKPQSGETVVLRGTANLHTGGHTRDCTDELSEKVKQEAIEIAQLLQLPVVGIDYLSEDINSKRYIIELNGDPGIQLHHFPTVGQPQFPSQALIESLK